MIKRIAAAGMLTLFCAAAHAQQNYDASLISKDLLPYASSVIRNEEITIEVKDLDNAVYHVKKAITVLNKNGDEDAHIEIYHDKNDVIRNVKGVVYDGFGKQTTKFSESKFDDVSVAGESLFDSQRAEHYLPPVTEYPYTVAYEYEEKSKQTLNFDPWRPSESTGIAVEQSSFNFICSPGFNIKIKELNLPAKGTMTRNAQGQNVYSWRVSNLKALKYEPFSPDVRNFGASVQIAPEKFEYYGLKGSYSNWNDLGAWISEKLMANRQTLPYQTIEHVKEITKDIADPKLKAKRIYEYMQHKTHYISVQVGVGGYQPFLASDVDQLNYGDCKALVNYTQALLQAVNIDSYYCIVKSGRDHNLSLLSDFPSMGQADHIILCVPFKNDTTWADCTSQTIPFGYLGDFTDDRTVLALTPQGGKLLHTPRYPAPVNVESRKAEFTLNTAGALAGTMTTVFKGVEYENRDEIIKEPRTEQVKMLQKEYPINNMDIDGIEFKQDKGFDPATTETIKLYATDYATVNDGRFYFLLNPANRQTWIPKQVRNRQNSVYITRGNTEIDEVTYTIPPGYRLEKKKLHLEIDKPFGNFKVHMELQGNKLIYQRRFQLLGGTYDKDTYPDVVDFFQSVADADDYNVVLVKAD